MFQLVSFNVHLQEEFGSVFSTPSHSAVKEKGKTPFSLLCLGLHKANCLNVSCVTSPAHSLSQQPSTGLIPAGCQCAFGRGSDIVNVGCNTAKLFKITEA